MAKQRRLMCLLAHPDHIAICQFTTAAVMAAVSPNYDTSGAPCQVSKLYYLVETQEKLAAYQKVFGDLVMEIDNIVRCRSCRQSNGGIFGPFSPSTEPSAWSTVDGQWNEICLQDSTGYSMTERRFKYCCRSRWRLVSCGFRR